LEVLERFLIVFPNVFSEIIVIAFHLLDAQLTKEPLKLVEVDSDQNLDEGGRPLE
jgi:hypothetical protein